jgi:hypothetical protein
MEVWEMSDDKRQDHLVAVARRLLAEETKLAEAAVRSQSYVREPAAAREVVERLEPLARAHAEALKAYVTQEDGSLPEPQAPDHLPSTAPDDVSGFASLVLQDLYVQLDRLAIGYAAFHAAAMRLFEPPIRQLAPKHLREHAETAQTIALVLPQVTALELAARGLNCMCVCPMCSIGICGCVAGATGTVAQIWRDTAPKAAEQPGYLLQSPRPGSQMAEHSVPGGAFLIAVNGQRAPEHDASGVQALINSSKHGEDIRLEIRVGDELREMVVRRADKSGP